MVGKRSMVEEIEVVVVGWKDVESVKTRSRLSARDGKEVNTLGIDGQKVN